MNRHTFPVKSGESLRKELIRWLQLRSLPKPPCNFSLLSLFFPLYLPFSMWVTRRGRGEGEVLEYRMPLSSYLNSKADIAAALIDLPDPEAQRKTNADNSTAGSNSVIGVEQNWTICMEFGWRGSLFRWGQLYSILWLVLWIKSSSSSSNIKH